MKRFLSVALSAVLAMSAFCSVGTCVLADDYENEVTSTLALNKLRGTFNVVATKAPGFGDNQKEI